MKIAIFHSFLKVKGGAEAMMVNIKEKYNGDFWTGSILTSEFNATKTDFVNISLFGKGEFVALTEERTDIFYFPNRIWNLAFNQKIKELLQYDVVLFAGNLWFVQTRLRKLIQKTGSKTKLINYCNTPPRFLCDQREEKLAKFPAPIKFVANKICDLALHLYKKDIQNCDVIIGNSQNIQKRIKKYLNLDVPYIFPPCKTCQYLGEGEYFLSHSRLEDMKRIRLIVEAFAKMPDKKIIFCSTGPLKNWLVDQCKIYPNITYEGIVSEERLVELIGSCKAGIVIPIDEDAGMVQVELMSAGKPVLAVSEGGMLETVIEGETGYFVPANPTVQDIVSAVQKFETLKDWKPKCIAQAKLFSETAFFEQLDKYIKL